MKIFITFLDHIFMSIIKAISPKRAMELTAWRRNGKVLSVLEVQGIRIGDSLESPDKTTFSFLVDPSRSNSLTTLNPYLTSNSEVKAMSWMNLWETTDREKPSEAMSIAERVYTLMHRNSIDIDSIEVDTDSANAEIVHMYFA